MPSDSEEASRSGAQILLFCNVTGASRQMATHYLETYSGNLELAVNMFLEQSDVPMSGITPRASTSREEVDSGVRAPIPQHQGILVEDGYDWLGTQVVRRRGSRTVFDPFRDFNVESKRQHDLMTNRRRSSHSRTLDDLFRPPIDITFKGSFENVREAGRLWHKWILVDVQNIREFQCQCLNRDIWSNTDVRELVKKEFVLWQIYIESIEGQKFVHFYKVKQYPYVAIIDPRTGENMHTWTKIKLGRFIDALKAFLQAHPCDSLKPLSDLEPDQFRQQEYDAFPVPTGLSFDIFSNSYHSLHLGSMSSVMTRSIQPFPSGSGLKKSGKFLGDSPKASGSGVRKKGGETSLSRPGISKKGKQLMKRLHVPLPPLPLNGGERESPTSIPYRYTAPSSSYIGEGSKKVKKGPYIPPTYALSIQASGTTESPARSREKRNLQDEDTLKTDGEYKKPKTVEGSNVTKKSDPMELPEKAHPTCIIDADEEEQLQAAIQASINETNETYTCNYLVDDDDDYDFDDDDDTEEGSEQVQEPNGLSEKIKCESENNSKSDLPSLSGIDEKHMDVPLMFNVSPDEAVCDKDSKSTSGDIVPDSTNCFEIDSPKSNKDEPSEEVKPINLMTNINLKSKIYPNIIPKFGTESSLPQTSRVNSLPTDEDRNYTLMIRYPDDTKDELTMPGSTQIQALISYVAMKGFRQGEYDLMTNYPKRFLSKISQDYTLNEIGFCSQETIFVHPK